MRLHGRTVTRMGPLVADVTKGDRRGAPVWVKIAGAQTSTSEIADAGRVTAPRDGYGDRTLGGGRRGVGCVRHREVDRERAPLVRRALHVDGAAEVGHDGVY